MDINQLFRTAKNEEMRTGFYKTYPLNDFWSSSNFNFMNDIINSTVSPSEKLRSVINSQLYSHGQTDPLITSKQFEWWQDFYSKQRNVRVEDFKVKESSFWPTEKTIVVNNIPYSIDLFRSYIYCLEILKYCKFDNSKRKRIMELGSGCGSLCRVLSSEIPNTSYILVDIPESLYFAYLFITLNFPEKKAIWVSDPSFDMNTVDQYDYVFVPVVFYKLLTGLSIDLFANTCSLGEMTNTVVSIWFDMIQNKMQTNYLFSVNRFLNTLRDRKDYHWRLNENECQAHFDSSWTMLRWRLEPEFTLCPYYEGFAARCLEIIAQRSPSTGPERDKELAYQLMNNAKLEDWYRLKGNDFTMTLNDNQLSFDFELTGTLSKLWNSIRLCPNKTNVSMIMQYMDMLLKSRDKVFEETFYYKALLARAPK